MANLPHRERTIDHLQPLSRGGTTSPDNEVPCCAPCNKAKGSLTVAEYQRHRRDSKRLKAHQMAAHALADPRAAVRTAYTLALYAEEFYPKAAVAQSEEAQP